MRAALGERLANVADGLRVSVANATVEVEGELETGAQKSLVDEIVARVPGVRAVTNRVRICPPSKLAMRRFPR